MTHPPKRCADRTCPRMALNGTDHCPEHSTLGRVPAKPYEPRGDEWDDWAYDANGTEKVR